MEKVDSVLLIQGEYHKQIARYQFLDSLKSAHIHNCAFISTDELKIDKNNYVYIKPATPGWGTPPKYLQAYASTWPK